ncbi:endoribonuclease L-PSP [Xanthomonas cannabis pv. phaseoli]|uniref:Endoribonuclease L-PSP n=1 Tax=Xanthomonas cannabis pv. phaseoli TaxID=1885902 RepID=A0AB34PBZ2_9XANT|nr:Rid family hydrolase [Xanthomonas cannabis]KGK58448.1 endoribonuclease L-PSP [Xanthomonas cannabis pv. phaseoli]KHL58427.1 endoribonuclease L-PSP [Xanthomonas cannabis pv. cannabis]KHL58545.1 endoribonuclease L-PSP [Xanthomonas cannabis pv. cannabis]MCC8443660.1 RidA family protein [Xanthomonas cannabis]
MATRDVVLPPGRHALYERHRYSPAVRADGLLFVAGQVGSREDGSPEPDLDAEIARAFSNLDAILSAAGCTSQDVVDVTLFMVDPEVVFDAAWNRWADYWGPAPYPTVTAVGVTWLAGFRFEIKVVVKLPATDHASAA